MTGPADDPIEAYLDELLVVLDGPPRAVRHQLAEAEAHLRDSAAELVAQGRAPDDAARAAVARFGPPRELARAEAARQQASVRDLLVAALSAAWRLGTVAALAVGLSGVLAAVVRAVWGPTFLAGTPSVAQRTAGDCARWIANWPGHTCAAAATRDWAYDTVLGRVAVGVLGLLAGGAWLWWQRRRPARRTAARLMLPAVVVNTIAVTCFGAATVWLVGQSIDSAVVAAGHGAGRWVSAAPVALAASGYFLVRLVGDLRGRGPAVEGRG